LTIEDENSRTFKECAQFDRRLQSENEWFYAARCSVTIAWGENIQPPISTEKTRVLKPVNLYNLNRRFLVHQIGADKLSALNGLSVNKWSPKKSLDQTSTGCRQDRVPGTVGWTASVLPSRSSVRVGAVAIVVVENSVRAESGNTHQFTAQLSDLSENLDRDSALKCGAKCSDASVRWSFQFFYPTGLLKYYHRDAA
jgi:hypothetical protein